MVDDKISWLKAAFHKLTGGSGDITRRRRSDPKPNKKLLITSFFSVWKMIVEVKMKLESSKNLFFLFYFNFLKQSFCEFFFNLGWKRRIFQLDLRRLFFSYFFSRYKMLVCSLIDSFIHFNKRTRETKYLWSHSFFHHQMKWWWCFAFDVYMLLFNDPNCLRFHPITEPLANKIMMMMKNTNDEVNEKSMILNNVDQFIHINTLLQ